MLGRGGGEEGRKGVLFALSESLILFCTVSTGGMKRLGGSREVSESSRAEEDAEPGCRRGRGKRSRRRAVVMKTGRHNPVCPSSQNTAKSRKESQPGNPDFIRVLPSAGSEGTPWALIVVTKTRKRGEVGKAALPARLLHSGYGFCSCGTEPSEICRRLPEVSRDDVCSKARNGNVVPQSQPDCWSASSSLEHRG